LAISRKMFLLMARSIAVELKLGCPQGRTNTITVRTEQSR
jgi:hypothetical protein